MRHPRFLVPIAAALVLACGLVSFDVERPIPEQSVPGSPIAALLPEGLFQIPLQIDIESSVKAHGASAASSAHLKSLTLTITDPPGETFGFLDSITITIAADGQPTRELATLSPVPKAGTISVTPTPGLDILPYVKAGATNLKASAAGHAPSRDLKFNGKVVVNIKV
jgi:hypothetical protein